MGSIISKIADEINLHGGYEAYCAWRDREETSFAPKDEILYFPDPEVVNPEIEITMDFNHTIDAFNYALRAHLSYLRANRKHDGQKGSSNNSLGST